MRAFRYDEVSGRHAIDGDALHERWIGRTAADRSVEILRLRAEHAASQQICEAWLTYAARNAACHAPGLLAVKDFGMHAGAAYVSREYADDALTLATLLALMQSRGESVSAMLGIHIARELCDILSVAHNMIVDGRAHPLLHGDLCAERVLVRADGRLQLAELGFWLALPPALSVRLRSHTAPAEHLAPELIQGGVVDERSDVFGLGILLRRMWVSGADAPVGGATRRFVPALPPREIVMLLSRLISPSVGERPRNAVALQIELAQLQRHAAGAAVLAQLHEDARGSIPTLPASAPPEEPLGSKKTAMFVAPFAAGGSLRAPAIPTLGRETSSGFRGRTQVFGSPPLAQTMAQESLQTERAVAKAPEVAPTGEQTRGRFGTLRLTQNELPPLLAPVTSQSEGPRDDMPPLLTGPNAQHATPRHATGRLDLTGMPPLLHEAPTERPPPPQAGQLTQLGSEGLSMLHGATAAHALAAPPLRASEPTPIGRQSGNFSIPPMRFPSAPPDSYQPGMESSHHESGLRRSPAMPPEKAQAPILHESAVSRERVEAPPLSPVTKRREPWREASETVFKLKVPPILSKVAPRERLSSSALFVLAMVAAAVLIVAVGLLIRFIIR